MVLHILIICFPGILVTIVWLMRAVNPITYQIDTLPSYLRKLLCDDPLGTTLRYLEKLVSVDPMRTNYYNDMSKCTTLDMNSSPVFNSYINSTNSNFNVCLDNIILNILYWAKSEKFHLILFYLICHVCRVWTYNTRNIVESCTHVHAQGSMPNAHTKYKCIGNNHFKWSNASIRTQETIQLRHSDPHQCTTKAQSCDQWL